MAGGGITQVSLSLHQSVADAWPQAEGETSKRSRGMDRSCIDVPGVSEELLGQAIRPWSHPAVPCSIGQSTSELHEDESSDDSPCHSPIHAACPGSVSMRAVTPHHTPRSQRASTFSMTAGMRTSMLRNLKRIISGRSLVVSCECPRLARDLKPECLKRNQEEGAASSSISTEAKEDESSQPPPRPPSPHTPPHHTPLFSARQLPSTWREFLSVTPRDTASFVSTGGSLLSDGSGHQATPIVTGAGECGT